jgi:hypothetical protein
VSRTTAHLPKMQCCPFKLAFWLEATGHFRENLLRPRAKTYCGEPSGCLLDVMRPESWQFSPRLYTFWAGHPNNSYSSPNLEWMGRPNPMIAVAVGSFLPIQAASLTANWMAANISSPSRGHMSRPRGFCRRRAGQGIQVGSGKRRCIMRSGLETSPWQPGSNSFQNPVLALWLAAVGQCGFFVRH